MKSRLLFSTLTLVVVAGCSQGPYEVAPVSGVVTLNGEPLADATVSFAPHGGGKEVVGPGSSGVTDSSGRYELQTFKDEEGAVVGTHTVRISTFKSTFEDLRNSDALKIVSPEYVPVIYNRNTNLTFEVPSRGTDEANFDLTGEPPRRR